MTSKFDNPSIKRPRAPRPDGEQPDLKAGRPAAPPRRRAPRPESASEERRPRPKEPQAGRSNPARSHREFAEDTELIMRPRRRPAPGGDDRSLRQRRPGTNAGDVASRRGKTLEGLGELLKTRREVQGFTRRDILMKIKIPLDQLEAIEEGRLSSLPPVFAKGFLRVYASELGLNADAILDDYRQMTGGFKNEPAASTGPLSSRYGGPSVGPNRWQLSPRVLVVGVLLLATFLAVFWLWPGFRNLFPGGGEAAADRPGIPLSLGGPGLSPGDTVAVTAIPARVSVSATGTLSPPPKVGEGLAATTPARGGGILTLASQKDNVWLEVAVDGNPPQHLTLDNGQQVTWESQQYITVISGLANSLVVNWNGKNMGLLGEIPVVETIFPKG